MLFSLVISVCAALICGAPLEDENCMQIAGDSFIEPFSKSDFTLRLRDNDTIRNLCSGECEDGSIAIVQCDKESTCILFYNRHGNFDDLIKNLSNTFRQRIRYTCIDKQKTCIDIRIINHISNSVPIKRLKRGITTTGNEPLSRPLPPNWVIILVSVTVSLLLLSMTVILCVKNTPSEVNLSQQSGLKIIDGPPPDYLTNRQKSNSIVVTETHSITNDTMTQEARVRLDQVSPSSVSDDRQGSSSPNEDVPTPKKTQDPLPPTPKKTQDPLPPKKTQDPLPPTPIINVETNNDESEEENPYDIAETDKNRSNSNEDNGDVDVLGTPPAGAMGSYAKVSRHSGNQSDQGNGYAEVGQLRHPPIGRVRSSTEPVEPLPPLPPITKPRTLSTNEASHMPLPQPPKKMEEKPYDSIGNTLADEEKVYDSLDDDENDMYESVPEGLKEELVGINHSVHFPVPTRSPKDNESFSSAHSPTKPAPDLCPDSPTSKKGLKKAAKKKISNDDDLHRPKISLLNRFRSSSTSTGTGRSRKEKRVESSLASPDHTHLSEPIPLPPISLSESIDEDDDNDMYDSVNPAQILDIKLRSSSLPIGARSSLLFSPRITEPLPEVPEDSGSDSKGVLVTRDRHTETNDPNYDIVVRPVEGMIDNDDDEDEDTYDTVKPRVEPSPQSLPLHSYAKVTGHNPTTRGETIDHDDKGYALVDPNVVMRKRAASLTKQQSEDKQSSMDVVEPPYDRVIKDGDKCESPYDRVIKDDESPYEKIKKVEDEIPYDEQEMDESPYDRVKTNDMDESPYDDEEDESPYDKVGNGVTNDNNDRRDTDDPGYATTVTIKPLENKSNEDEPPSSSFDFKTETIAVEDTTYSHVDLAKKYEQRRLKQQQSIENDSSTNPDDPSMQQQSSFSNESLNLQPPPIPTYYLDSSGSASPDPDYDVIGPGTVKLSHSHTETESATLGNEQDTEEISSLGNPENTEQLLMPDELHVYDTLEDQHMYDSLEPQSASVNDNSDNQS